MSDDLVEFLRARLDEDERAARGATGVSWRPQFEDMLGYGKWWSVQSGEGDASVAVVDAGPEGGGAARREDAAHIARHDPARVLADVEAKRRIVESYRQEQTRRDAYQADDARAVEGAEQATRRRSSAARCGGLEIAVELLALPYADHPEYRADEWSPDA